MNINATMKRLQKAILQHGLVITISRGEFYSVDQNRFIPMITLSTKVFHYYEKIGEWKDQVKYDRAKMEYRSTKNTKSKHNVDAKYGFYKYTTRFGIKTKSGGVKEYQAELVIRRASDKRSYLYDITDKKK